MNYFFAACNVGYSIMLYLLNLVKWSLCHRFLSFLVHNNVSKCILLLFFDRSSTTVEFHYCLLFPKFLCLLFLLPLSICLRHAVFFPFSLPFSISTHASISISSTFDSVCLPLCLALHIFTLTHSSAFVLTFTPLPLPLSVYSLFLLSNLLLVFFLSF